MAAETIEIEDDTSFHSIWPLTDDDDDPLVVIGWSATAQIRARPGGEVLESFEVELTEGQLSLKLEPETRIWKTARFDVRLVDPEGNVSRPVYGKVKNKGTITR